MDSELVTSRYTFRIPIPTGYALFNCSTGSVLRMEGADSAELSAILAGPPVRFQGDAIHTDALAVLLRDGFLIDYHIDEVGVIQRRYQTARSHAPVVLLVATTMDCNLGCYYCYETRSTDRLTEENINDLVALARQLVARNGKRSLHVDWYGGEPLVNLEFMEKASFALQQLCAAEGIAYHASVVSNGTCWPADVGTFVAQHKLRQVQVSFDGLRDNHDRRRRFRPGRQQLGKPSAFECASALVDELIRHTRVDLRYNLDEGNIEDLAGFVDFAKDRGWFDAPFRCVLMVAKLAAYSDRSEFMRQRHLSSTRFAQAQALVRQALPKSARDDPSAVGDFPYPKTSVCGALALDSAVIGADGLEYRCGLQVGETHRAVGRLDRLSHASPPPAFADRGWWETFDPTQRTSCARCSFLPLCWGGCPKRHLENSQDDLDTECQFWRENLPRMIAEGLSSPLPADFVFTTREQFRDSPRESTPAGLRAREGAS